MSAKRLGIINAPELYISDEGIAAVEISSLLFKSEQYLRLNSYYALVASESEDYTTLSFDLGTELAHIALGHRSIIWVILTIPARVFPVYRHLYARTLNYSADKVAAELTGKYEAAEAIITLTHDPYLCKAIDKEAYYSDITKKSTAINWVSQFYYNLFLDQSVPAFRINAILDEKKSGRLF